MNPFLLWAIGLVLIFLEFYLPGAILGIIGGVLIFSSIIIFAREYGSPLEVLLFLLAVIASVVFLIRFALWKIRSTKSAYSIYSDKDQTGYVASTFDTNAIGKKGIVLSDLKPGGYILVEGKQHQAISQAGYITKGDEVLVLGGQEESLIVKRIKKDQTP